MLQAENSNVKRIFCLFGIIYWKIFSYNLSSKSGHCDIFVGKVEGERAMHQVGSGEGEQDCKRKLRESEQTCGGGGAFCVALGLCKGHFVCSDQVHSKSK